MTSSPQVSVIIPCYNDGRYLQSCLESVHAQTLQPLETIIINDGSTDIATIRELKSLVQPKLRIIDQENRGLAGARNSGIRNAEGDFIYFLDADDSIRSECLMTLAGLLGNCDDALAAASQTEVVGRWRASNVWGFLANPYEILLENHWVAGIMLRKDAVERYDLMYDESMRSGYEDWEFNIRLTKTGKPILFCPEPLYRYRVRHRSLLGTSRKHHVEIVDYIRRKHADVFAFERLLELKRLHTPALGIVHNDHDRVELESWLNSQTFRDWILPSDGASDPVPLYQLFHSGVEALRRLPPEAMECALMTLERYAGFHRCAIAVRTGCISQFATSARFTRPDGKRQPVALISRASATGRHPDFTEIFSNCELLLEFPDQLPGSAAGWSQTLIQFTGDAAALPSTGVDAFRKKLSSHGKNILGSRLREACIQLYDLFYYGVLCSDMTFAARRRMSGVLGQGLEGCISNFVFGLFLAQPPTEENILARRRQTEPFKSVAPLFLAPQDDRIHILIATAWLIEGGVEQIIFEICRLLDPKRFRVTIITTLPSFHSWDGVARQIGAAVYHLADLLKPADMVRGIVHLVLNNNVDCLYIMNSEATYRAAKTLKRVAPWLPIIDRVEAPDPGGGYPMISAKVGRNFIDLRTVSHKKLADFMCEKYRLGRDSVRVIYIGMNTKRINELAGVKQGLLHAQCKVNPETPIVLFLGRFENQKRPEVFVKIIEKIFHFDPRCSAHFAMVGDGHLFSPVAARIPKYPFGDRIHLLGAHPNAVELLADATILMMPSAYEGLALVSYEAMAVGVPQIFAKVGGQDELITAATGVLVENGPGEETRYARACLDLLSDPARRQLMAEAGKQRVRANFSAERAVAEYAAIFERLAEQSRNRAKATPHLRPPHIDPLRARME